MRPGTERTANGCRRAASVTEDETEAFLSVLAEFVQLSRVEFLRRRESDDVDGLTVTGDVLGREAAEMKKKPVWFGQIFVTITATSRSILLSYCQIYVTITKLC